MESESESERKSERKERVLPVLAVFRDLLRFGGV